MIGHNIRIKFKALFKVDGGLNGVKDGVKELTDIQCVIIREMENNPSITTRELAQKTNIKFRTIQRYINQLQEMGIVSRVGGRKEGLWEVKH